MKVQIANRTYETSKQKYKGLLKVASEQVPFGVYAVEKGNYAELRNDKATSLTNLKNMIHEWKKAGFKVYSNRG